MAPSDSYQKMEQIGTGAAIHYIHPEQSTGRGSYGIVFKGRSMDTGQIVAMKEIHTGGGEGMPSEVMHEISTLQALKHRNIVHLLDVFSTQMAITLVFEYCRQDLRSFMNQYGVLNHATVHSFMSQLLKGIRLCHGRNIYHRDLKPDNLLVAFVQGNWVLKIADFGLARPTNDMSDKTYEVATPWYRAPELLLHCTTYSIAIDIWSVGCVFAEMIDGKALFRGPMDERGQLQSIVRIIGSPTGVQCQKIREAHPEIMIPPELLYDRYAGISFGLMYPKTPMLAIDLLKHFLRFDPEERISASMGLSHPYFTDAQHQHASQAFNPPYFGTMLESHARQPHARQPQAQQPHARQPQARQPHARQGQAHQPYAHQPYAHQPYARQPYAHQPYAHQPYANQPRAHHPPKSYSSGPGFIPPMISFCSPPRDEPQSPAFIPRSVVFRGGPPASAYVRPYSAACGVALKRGGIPGRRQRVLL